MYRLVVGLRAIDLGVNPEVLDRLIYSVTPAGTILWRGRIPDPVYVLGLDLRIPGVCRICACTDDDCTDCIAVLGYPCCWVEPDLCLRCAAADEQDRAAQLDQLTYSANEIRALYGLPPVIDISDP